MVEPVAILSLSCQENLTKLIEVTREAELGLALGVVVEGDTCVLGIASDADRLNLCVTPGQVSHCGVGFEVSGGGSSIDLLQSPRGGLSGSQELRSSCFQPGNRLTIESTRFTIAKQQMNDLLSPGGSSLDKGGNEDITIAGYEVVNDILKLLFIKGRVLRDTTDLDQFQVSLNGTALKLGNNTRYIGGHDTE